MELRNMLINKYNSDRHKGIQPIRILEKNICNFDFYIDNDLCEELVKLIVDSVLSPKIEYHLDEKPIIDFRQNMNSQLPYIDENKIIHLQETFLSYLWINCYCMLVVFNEGIHKPLMDGNYSGIIVENSNVKDAFNLFDYGISLIKEYSIWDKDILPNPERYTKEAEKHITNTSGVYMFAVIFVILHEIAHAKYNTIGLLSKFESKIDEQQADNWALHQLTKMLDQNLYRSNIAIGLISALCSLLLLSKTILSETHPDTDRRIKRAIEYIESELGEKDNLYGYACLMFRLWDFKYNLKLSWHSNPNNYKEIFNHLEMQLH